MRYRRFPNLLVPLLLLTGIEPAGATEGFFKDLFIDGGCYLTPRESLAAAEYLGLSQEALFTPYEPVTDEHLRIQEEIVAGNEDDTNGRLLYPDGAPRFRMIQVNGGSATRHGRSLGEEGRQRIRDFYYNGGSYTGTCAGFFFATLAAFEEGTNQNYLQIWPGRVSNTGLADAYTGMFIEPDSPLLDYFDFGSDLYVADVRHNGGGYADEDHPDWPQGTEILARYDYPGRSMHQQVSCLAYKEDEQSGRLVIIGSHPEGVASGERRDLMAAMISYALDGQGNPQVKGELENGVWRTMDRTWEDDDPLFGRIGDRQVHHFYVDVPFGGSELSLDLEGGPGYDLALYVNYGAPAFPSTAVAESVAPGATQSILLSDPDEGRWFVGVHCATTVTETIQEGYTLYTGDLGVLNGVVYSIRAEVVVERYLVLELPDEVSESSPTATGLLRAVPTPPWPVEISLVSSDPGRLEVPEQLVLPAFQDSLAFELTPIDNAEPDPETELTVTACAEPFECGSAMLRLLDDDPEVQPTGTCDELGGTCCSPDQECRSGSYQESSDCGSACCLDGLCVDRTGEDSSDTPAPEETPDAGGSMHRTSSVGCTCQVGQGTGWWCILWVLGWPVVLLPRRRRSSG